MPTPRRASITTRAALIGCALIVANAFWIYHMEIVRYSPETTTVALVLNAVMWLIALLLLNAIGPVWEGNQVWFVTAGGALFAAWPVCAVAFTIHPGQGDSSVDRDHRRGQAGIQPEAV